MIDWMIFVPACFALNLAFGPNNLLAMTNGARSGVVFAQKAAIGRLIVFVPMIALSALGLGLVLTTSAFVFNVAKIFGAAYLVWLGLTLWRSARTLKLDDRAGGTTSLRRAFKAEALVAVSNPKAILIFAAFFPQFISIEAYWQSFALLGAAFLAMEAIAILAYAVFGRLASTFAAGRLPTLQRVSGATMCLFGALLLISPQPSRS
ncbi:MAG: LysE family translocator [Pseudomonadota bacterium]